MGSVRCIIVRGFEFEAGDKSIEQQIEKYRGEGFAVYIEDAGPAKPSANGPRERIRNLISDYGLNRRHVAALLGASLKSVDNWLTCKTTMNEIAFSMLERAEQQAATLTRRQLLVEAERLAKSSDQRRHERRAARKLARGAVEANGAAEVKKAAATVSDDAKLEMAALREAGLHYSAIAQRFGVATPVAYLAVREVMR